MQNAFPIQAFKRFASSTLVANVSDLIGFDVGVHEAAENKEIILRTPNGQAAQLVLTHFCMQGSSVAFWEFTNIMNSRLKAIIFND